MSMFFIDNVLYWFDEYCFDGLCIDVVYVIDDDVWLCEFVCCVCVYVGDVCYVYFVLENECNIVSLLGLGGFDV